MKIVLSDLIDVLNDNVFNAKASAGMNIGPRLALKLSHFTAKGQYGKFFDGKNQFKIDSRFTVFELANLSSHPDLQLVVLLNLMFFITNFVSDEKMLKERKFLLIDEAWQLLKMSNTADFIANAFKTFRKYRCSAVAITQEVADLLQQKSGLAIIANTANKIFLKQEHGVISKIQEDLALSDEIAAALKSVKTVKGKYSEALVITPSISGVIRLVPNPFLVLGRKFGITGQRLFKRDSKGKRRKSFRSNQTLCKGASLWDSLNRLLFITSFILLSRGRGSFKGASITGLKIQALPMIVYQG